jgi:transmembrane sensor
VRFQPADSPYDVVLTAYQAATYTGVHEPMPVHNLTSLNQLSWQSGGLEFVRTPLAQVVKDLENHYGVTVALENPQLAECLHTAPLTSQPIDKVLASLALTYGLTVRQPAAGNYVLSGGSCN